jgi:outer membrane protein assembly factor BamB
MVFHPGKVSIMRRKLLFPLCAGWFAVFLAFVVDPSRSSSSGPAEEIPPDLRTRKTGSDWPRQLGPLGDSKSTETGILTQWPPEGPPVRWTMPLGRGYSMPSIARGRLFVFDRKGDKARLFCLRSETGEELWRSEYVMNYVGLVEENGGPVASPVIDGNRVYTFGIEGRLRSHRVTDGALLWDVDTAAQFGVVQNLYGVGSTPWIEGDLLIAVIGGSPPDSPTSVESDQLRGNGSGIVAFDKYTGAVRYRITDELASYSSPIVASIGGRRWGFAFVRGGLVGFEPLKGTVDFFFPWRAKLARAVNAATPVVVDDTVFVTEAYGVGGALLRVRPGGYDVIWKDVKESDRSMACHFNTPIYHRGYLYGSSGRTGGEAELRCVEHKTGKVMWRQPGFALSSLLQVGEHLLVLTEFGRLVLIEANPERFQVVADVDLGGGMPNPGQPAAKPAAQPATQPAAQSADKSAKTPLLKYPVWNAPVLSNGFLYVRGWGRLVCFDLSAAPDPGKTPAAFAPSGR